MTREILVPVDGSEPASEALSFALEHHPDADITAYYAMDVVSFAEGPVLEQTGEFQNEFHKAKREYAKEVLADAESKAEKHGVDLDTHYERGYAQEAILDYADAHDVDQIIMGSHGHTGLTRVFLGSVAEKVARQAPVPVTIVRPEATAD
jgi:nucleotide-binding universal stress UspA family protein